MPNKSLSEDRALEHLQSDRTVWRRTNAANKIKAGAAGLPASERPLLQRIACIAPGNQSRLIGPDKTLFSCLLQASPPPVVEKTGRKAINNYFNPVFQPDFRDFLLDAAWITHNLDRGDGLKQGGELEEVV